MEWIEGSVRLGKLVVGEVTQVARRVKFRPINFRFLPFFPHADVAIVELLIKVAVKKGVGVRLSALFVLG